MTTEEIRARYEKATRDGLVLMRYSHGGGRLEARHLLIADFYDEGNCEFYHNAITDIPYLLAALTLADRRVAQLEQEIAELKAASVEPQP